ncbi:hypothetical protein [Corynebacterium propinquum]|nr:hypothetical protein [Corynebacterium propinquum]
MSNLKLVAGTMKRRGIAIAAAVAVAGGSLRYRKLRDGSGNKSIV